MAMAPGRPRRRVVVQRASWRRAARSAACGRRRELRDHPADRAAAAVAASKGRPPGRPPAAAACSGKRCVRAKQREQRDTLPDGAPQPRPAPVPLACHTRRPVASAGLSSCILAVGEGLGECRKLRVAGPWKALLGTGVLGCRGGALGLPLYVGRRAARRDRVCTRGKRPAQLPAALRSRQAPLCLSDC